MYRVSCYVIVTTAATTSSTLPPRNLIWTDNDNSNNQSANVTATHLDIGPNFGGYFQRGKHRPSYPAVFLGGIDTARR